ATPPCSDARGIALDSNFFTASPSALFKGTGIFLDGASTPPLPRRGVCRARAFSKIKCVYQIVPTLTFSSFLVGFGQSLGISNSPPGAGGVEGDAAQKLCVTRRKSDACTNRVSVRS